MFTAVFSCDFIIFLVLKSILWHFLLKLVLFSGLTNNFTAVLFKCCLFLVLKTILLQFITVVSFKICSLSLFRKQFYSSFFLNLLIFFFSQTVLQQFYGSSFYNFFLFPGLTTILQQFPSRFLFLISKSILQLFC